MPEGVRFYHLSSAGENGFPCVSCMYKWIHSSTLLPLACASGLEGGAGGGGGKGGGGGGVGGGVLVVGVEGGG